MRFNNIPPEIVHEMWDNMDKGMSSRDAEQWLAAEWGLACTHMTINGYYRNQEKYKYQTKTAKEIRTIKRQESTRIAKAAAKELEKERQRKLRARRNVRADINEATNMLGDKKLLEEDVFELAKEMGDVSDDDAAFSPNPGPQTDALASSETDLLYGGQAGGGKSVFLVVDPLRYAHRPKHRAIILRRTLKELRQLIDLSRDYYKKAFPAARYKEAEKVWVFPSGAKIEFNYLEKEADVYQYQGQDFSWIGFDELTQLPTEFAWNYLASRLRTTDQEIEPCMRATANPGNVGNEWVKKRYISPAPPNTTFVFGHDRWGNPMTRKFVPSRLQDNPYLWKDGKYEAMLSSLPEVQRRQLLEGDWDVFEGAAFPEFDKEIHVVEPFEIPRHWKRYRGVDYGYAAPSACLWGAINPEDGTLLIYRELYQSGLTGEQLAEKIREAEIRDIPMGGVVDWSVFNRQGYQNTIGSILNSAGLKLRPANKDRKAGKVQIHERLSTRNSARPALQFFSTCTNTIRELTTIPLKDNDPEDVDTNVDDHAYDALRYMCMDVPRATYRDMLFNMKRERRSSGPAPADPVFGY